VDALLGHKNKVDLPINEQIDWQKLWQKQFKYQLNQLFTNFYKLAE
jgi:hypothetical protein